jgi:aspartate carbamoyltransferase catalytic subunit
MNMKNLIKVEDLSKEEILEILKLVREIKENPENFQEKLKRKSLATLFFQQSTRTRISSSLAMQKLGGNVVDLYETKLEQGMSKEESFEDTIKIMGDYVDLICLRHDLEESPLIAEKNTNAKIINCGNGKDQHPTQALLDLFTIWEEFGRLDRLNIAIIGGIKNSRSAHSLIIALSLFENNKINLISPQNLKIPKKYLKLSKSFKETEDFDISEQDVVYMCGLTSSDAEEEIRKKYQMDKEKSVKLKKTAIILNPLPRIDEVKKEVDELPQSRYFEQSKNGVFVRMAIFMKILED